MSNKENRYKLVKKGKSYSIERDGVNAGSYNLPNNKIEAIGLKKIEEGLKTFKGKGNELNNFIESLGEDSMGLGMLDDGLEENSNLGEKEIKEEFRVTIEEENDFLTTEVYEWVESQKYFLKDLEKEYGLDDEALILSFNYDGTDNIIEQIEFVEKKLENFKFEKDILEKIGDYGIEDLELTISIEKDYGWSEGVFNIETDIEWLIDNKNVAPEAETFIEETLVNLIEKQLEERKISITAKGYSQGEQNSFTFVLDEKIPLERMEEIEKKFEFLKDIYTFTVVNYHVERREVTGVGEKEFYTDWESIESLSAWAPDLFEFNKKEKQYQLESILEDNNLREESTNLEIIDKIG